MKRERAIAVGQAALVWIAGEPDLLASFIDASGVAPEAIRARAAEPEFLGFLLDFVLAADASVLAFAEHAGVAPEDASGARAALGGGEPHWT